MPIDIATLILHIINVRAKKLMVLVDGEAEDKLTNQHKLKLGWDYPIG